MGIGWFRQVSSLGILLLMAAAAAAERVKYNHPGLEVDLGVGLWAWPMPMDWDGDGDLDLIVSCPDVPYNGTYFFENPGGDAKMPVFKPAVRLGAALKNVQLSIVGGKPRVLTPGTEWEDFLGGTFEKNRRIHPKTNIHSGKIRANQWRSVDYDGDGDQDLVVGVGDWADYGWDNAFNRKGEWTRGPLHGFVYLLKNNNGSYAEPVRVEPVDVFGMPSPNFADFDSDGDLDLLCGEFLDGFTYFRNEGSRTEPRYAKGRKLAARMDLQMITPTAIDWDGDGDIDLICGDEDGRVAFIENSGKLIEGISQFLPPRYFRQVADEVKFGALVTPVSVDWDGDGDEDLICGNTAGYVGFIENLDGGNPPKWAAPVHFKAGGKVLRIEAGNNGSIQGPAEVKWGYTTLSVADWNHDGRLDLVVNSIWGRVVWYRNTEAGLAAAKPVAVRWDGNAPKPSWNWWDPEKNELVTQWRTTPVVIDWDEDGLNDLVMLDHEGYLAWFQRERMGDRLILKPGNRIFRSSGKEGPLRLNDRTAGRSGRRKLCIVDWDGDGKRDLLLNSASVTLLRNAGKQDGSVIFEEAGSLSGRRLAGHTTSPTTVDWDGNGVRDLLIGAEDGFLYHVPNQAVAFSAGGGRTTPAEAGPLAGVQGKPAHRSRDRQPHLAGTFRPRAGRDLRRLWVLSCFEGDRASLPQAGGKAFPNHLDRFHGGLGVDGQRWSEFEHSSAGGEHQNATANGLDGDPVGQCDRWFPGFRILQMNRYEQPRAVDGQHVRGVLLLESPQGLKHHSSCRRRGLDQPFGFERLQVSQSCGRAHRISTLSAGHLSWFRFVHDRCWADNSRYRQTARQTLSQGHQVGCYADVFEPEELAGPATSTLDLIEADQDVVLPRPGSECTSESFWDRPGGPTRDRLPNKARDPVGGDAVLFKGLNTLRERPLAGGIISDISPGPAESKGERDLIVVQPAALDPVLGIRLARGRIGRQRTAMISSFKAEDADLLRMDLPPVTAHQHDGAFGGFGARAEQDCLRILDGRQCHQLLQQAKPRLLRKGIGGEQFVVGRLADGLEDPRMGVACVGYDDAAGQIDPLVAEPVTHHKAFSLIPKHWRHAAHRPRFGGAQPLDDRQGLGNWDRSHNTTPACLDSLSLVRFQLADSDSHQSSPSVVTPWSAVLGAASVGPVDQPQLPGLEPEQAMMGVVSR